MGAQAFYARICGQVQGVGFRYSALREARRLRITGWVRNAPNGDVEVWAEGAGEGLAAFLSWLRRGPQFARVDSVETEDKNPGGFQDFAVEYQGSTVG
ncbi:MAG: acylphosphatase [Treponema sp.]|jgi:acylphosphatase|nr:acylphosphatase [Treponema sp.]